MGKGASVENQERRSDDFDAERHQKLLAQLRDLFSQLSAVNIYPTYLTTLPVETDLNDQEVDHVIEDITDKVTEFMLGLVIADAQRYSILGPLLAESYDRKKTVSGPDKLLDPTR